MNEYYEKKMSGTTTDPTALAIAGAIRSMVRNDNPMASALLGEELDAIISTALVLGYALAKDRAPIESFLNSLMRKYGSKDMLVFGSMEEYILHQTEKLIDNPDKEA